MLGGDGGDLIGGEDLWCLVGGCGNEFDVGFGYVGFFEVVEEEEVVNEFDFDGDFFVFEIFE